MKTGVLSPDSWGTLSPSAVLVSPEGRIIAATCGWEHLVTRTIDPRECVGRGVFGNRAMARTYSIERSEELYERKYRENLRGKR